MYKYDIMLYGSTLPDKAFSAQTYIASPKFLFLKQSLNFSQQFPFNFCSFPAGQGEALPQGELSLGSLVGTQLCPIWLLLEIMGLCSMARAKTPLRTHPAPQRDFISPLLSKELEADTALASKSRSRSCITPWSQADFLPSAVSGCWAFPKGIATAGPGVSEKPERATKQPLRGLVTAQRHHRADPSGGLLAGTAHKETTTLTALKQHQPGNRKNLHSRNPLRHTPGNR